MHDHREAPSSKTSGMTSRQPDHASSSKPRREDHDDEDHEPDERFPQPEGDAEGGYSYESTSHVPLMARERVEEEEVIFESEEDSPKQNGHADAGPESRKTELVPYAHRDLKPGFGFLDLHETHSADRQIRNVMIADDGTPILMDFGSAIKARINIETRSQALFQQVCIYLHASFAQLIVVVQDIAAEQSTMAYRAPELFDVKTGVALDEKVDIWVSPSNHHLIFINSHHCSAVAGVHSFRAGLFPFSL
jgi:serine/threonine kinase 16